MTSACVVFLPESDVVDGMQIGAALLPYRRGRNRQATDAASDLLQRLTTAPLFRASALRPLPPLFPVSTWNVHVATLNGDFRTRRGGASLRWSVATACRRCGAPSSHCSRMQPRRRRHCCRMLVVSCRQSISRCSPRFCC